MSSFFCSPLMLLGWLEGFIDAPNLLSWNWICKSCLRLLSELFLAPFSPPICKHIIMFYWIAFELKFMYLPEHFKRGYLCIRRENLQTENPFLFYRFLFACYSPILFICRSDLCKYFGGKEFERQDNVMLCCRLPKARRDFRIWSWKLNWSGEEGEVENSPQDFRRIGCFGVWNPFRGIDWQIRFKL